MIFFLKLLFHCYKAAGVVWVYLGAARKTRMGELGSTNMAIYIEMTQYVNVL